MSVNKIATDASYVVNALSFSWAAMTFNNWMMLFSMLFGFSTVLISWHYKRKEDIRQSEKHAIEMTLVKGKHSSGVSDG